MDKSALFCMAWAIARAAVLQFGGKSREYFPESLKLAYMRLSAPTMEECLLKAGGKEWHSLERFGNQHRIYPSIKFLINKMGLCYTDCPKAGKRAWLRGKEITMVQAEAAKRVVKNGSLWWDVRAQEFFFDRMRTDYGNAIAKTILRDFKEGKM